MNLWIALLLLNSARASEWINNQGIQEIVSTVKPGSILVLGEIHDRQDHHDNQVAILEALMASGLKVQVGMEFFEYTHQSVVDRFSSGQLTEVDFLKEIAWSGFSYDFYRKQVDLSIQSSGRVSAINAPGWLTKKIAKNGLVSLTPTEFAVLPPGFTLGADSYRKRFQDLMGGGHVPQQLLDQYFAAQSAWDDTMAFWTIEQAKADPQAVFVVIVGDFHVAFGGGVPNRIRARSSLAVTTVSQIDSTGFTPDELKEAIEPSKSDGVRADFIFNSF